MTCHEARERFSALVDDALGAAERDALGAHLTACADCRRELQRVRDTVALLRAVEPARAPAGFVDRVLAAARPVPWPRRLLRSLFLPWPLKLPIEAAAVVLVAVGVVYVFRATPELQQAARLEPSPPVATEAPRGVASPPSTPRPELSTPSPQPSTPSPAPEKDRQPAKHQTPGKNDDIEKKAAAAAPRDEAQQRAAGLKDASRDFVGQKEESRPAPPAESQIVGKLQAPQAPAEREPGADKESARRQLAPAPQSRIDPQARRPTTGSSTATSFAPPDVSGRLAVSDRDAALGRLAELVARVGGVEDRRLDGPEGPIIELTIPREAYAEFARELARLGRWQPTREPTALPAQARVVVRIGR